MILYYNIFLKISITALTQKAPAMPGLDN